MNIFVLDNSIEKSVQYHVDKHIVKMILESAQILCTVVQVNGGVAPYKLTHRNHPCTLWAGKSIENFLWLKEFALALNDEYRYRYDRDVDHKSATVVKGLTTPSLPSIGMTPFAKAMPDDLKRISDPVEAYRKYYIQEKSHIAKWTKRPTPYWFKEIN